MKRQRLLAIGIIIALVLTGCSSYETKTYILEDITDGEVRTHIDIDRIYDYCYNISTYGNEDLAKNRTAWWSPAIDRRIIINQHNNGNNTNYINKVDYEYGFSEPTGEKKWDSYDIPLGISPNGKYMLYERRLSDVRYLILYDYESLDNIIITMIDPKIIPTTLFEPVFCWSKNGNQLVYGWKYHGKAKHILALNGDYYYNDWRYGKESIYSIQCYNVAKKETTKVYELGDWMFHEKVYDYSIQINDNGMALIFSNDDKWLYCFNILKPSQHKIIKKQNSLLEHYWLGEQGIYIQDDYKGIVYYQFDSDKWELLSSETKDDEIDHFVASKDGNTLYFTVRQKPKTYAEQTDNRVWDVYRYSVDTQDLECMYQGADDVIGLDLSSDENNLMLEMRDYSYHNRYKDSLLTRLFVFKS